MKKIFILITILTVAISCYKDKGNYDYKKGNKMKVLGYNGNKYADPFFDVRIGTTVEITPEIVFEKEDDSEHLKYIWTSLDEKAPVEERIDVPCFYERVFKMKVEDLPSFKRGKKREYLKFEVHNQKTGEVVIGGVVTLEILSEFYKSWVVLSENDNKSIISNIEWNWISENDDDNERLEIKTTKNCFDNSETPLGNDVTSIRAHYSDDHLSTANILAIKKNYPYSIDIWGDKFKESVYTSKYFVGDVPNNFAPISELYIIEAGYIFNEDGRVFTRRFDDKKAMQSGVFSKIPLVLPGTNTKITKTWHLGHTYGQFGLVFDDTNKRLLFASMDARIVETKNSKNDDIGFPDFNALNGEVLYLEMAEGKTTQQFPISMIYKSNETNEIKLLRFAVNSTLYSYQAWQGRHFNVTILKQAVYPLLEASENSVFCQPPSISDVLFYTDKNNNKLLYRYSTTTRRSTPYYKFESPIVAMEAEHTSGAMAVALENGEIHIIDIRATAYPEDQSDNRSLFVEKGFGNVIQMCYKRGVPRWV